MSKSEVDFKMRGPWLEQVPSPEALGMSVKTVSASDPKIASQQWIKNNWSGLCSHMYDNLHNQTTGGHCIMHDKKCVPDPDVDCYMTGTACQAWTRQRAQAKEGTPASDHWGWAVTFSDMLAFVDSHEVAGGIAEQVIGFADDDKHSDPAALCGERSPYKLFIKSLETRHYFHITFRLNMSTWLTQPPRNRLYIIYLKESLGGEAAIAWMQGAMKDCSVGFAYLCK